MGSVLLPDPVAVVTTLNVGHPVGVFQIPLHGLANTGIEGFCGFPAQFPVDFAGVDGVPIATRLGAACGHHRDRIDRHDAAAGERHPADLHR